MFGSYELDRFDPDIVYIHTTNKNIIKYSNIKDSFQDVEDLLSNEISMYKQILNELSKFDCPIAR